MNRALSSRLSLCGAIFLFVVALALQWNGPQSIAVADEIAYLVSGTNLVARGEFTNPFGEPELWFPPVYPFLIGVFSLGGGLDPFPVARLISAAASIVTLVLVYELVRRTLARQDSLKSNWLASSAAPIALVSVLILAANPAFQSLATRALSESLATSFVVAALFSLVVPKRTSRSAAVTGLLVGLAVLTRPECLLCLPLWMGAELLLERSRLSLRRMIIAGTVCAGALMPYSVWLHQHTGRWSISNKAEVNLAAGRAAFHGTPREFIDPATLSMTYFPTDRSLATETQRYLFNWKRLQAAFAECSPAVFGAALLGLTALSGIWILRRDQKTLLLALLMTLPYLLVVAVFDVTGAKNLHAALPALCVFSGVGLIGFAQRWRTPGVLLVLLMLLGLSESATRYPRWNQTTDRVPATELKTAGLQLRSSLSSAGTTKRGVLYENGATIGWYAGLIRRRLTPNNLETVLAWIEQQEPEDRPVYFAVATHTLGDLDASVRSLLTEHPPGMTKIIRLNGPREVVVFRIERQGRRPLTLNALQRNHQQSHPATARL